MPVPRANRRTRGIVLNDLDRTLIWRIGYVGRRWEVLGSEAAAGCGAGPDEGPTVKRSADGPSPRHAAPEVLSQQGESTLRRHSQ